MLGNRVLFALILTGPVVNLFGVQSVIAYTVSLLALITYGFSEWRRKRK